jgi:ribonuclease HIII
LRRYDNAFECYEDYKTLLERLGFEVGEYKKINCGLQFEIRLEQKKGIIRIYEGKKGINIDLSQIRDAKILHNIHKDLNVKCIQCGENIINDDPNDIIGTDESGKGDYFGPLVIAGVYINGDIGPKLKSIGVDDSKKLSAKQIETLSAKIKKMCKYSVVTIGNERYNELYQKLGNLNLMLAWGHARAIENLLNIVDCKNALSDKFGDSSLIENALMEKGKNINLMQRPRAEDNAAVAAASILARNEFVVRMDALSAKYRIKFPKGASSGIIEAAREFTAKYGMDELKHVAKLHFKTTGSI